MKSNKALTGNESQQLAVKLDALFKNHKVNANQVAQKLGIPMMTIRRLISGETADPRISTLKLIADHFNVSIDLLLDEEKSHSSLSLAKVKPHFVPVLDWSTAEKINTSIHDLDLSTWKEWQPVSLNEQDELGKNAFALASRPSMYPRFPQGTLFIFDPDLKPTDGDIILVKIKGNDELTLRELLIDPPEWKLQPIVPGSNTLHYSKKDHSIMGVSLLTVLYNRKSPG